MSKGTGIIRGFLRPIAVLLAVVVFFVSYNRFLIDHSLEVLRFSLDEVSKATTTEEAQGIDMLLDYTIIKEVSGKTIDSKNLANLEFAKNNMQQAKTGRQLEDVQFALKDMVSKKLEKRGVILNSLDAAASKFIAAMGYLRHLPSTMKGRFAKTRRAVDMTMYDKAALLENEWKLDEASKMYEKFIAEYYTYKDIAIAKLRLGYVYQKMGDRKKSRQIFREVKSKYYGTRVARIADSFLLTESDYASQVKQREALLKKIDAATTVADSQQAYYTLGVLEMNMMHMDKAEESFNKVVELDPTTELADRAKFSLGWDYKFQAKYAESKLAFQEIVDKKPDSQLAVDSQYQIADTLHKEGKYEESIAVLQEVATKSKSEDVASMAQFQIGTTYLYDLNNAKAAKEAFDKVRTIFKDTKMSDYTKTKLDKVGTGHRNRGFELFEREQYDEALGEFLTATEVNPQDGMGHIGLALTYAYLYRSKEALRSARTGRELVPDNPYAHALAGRVDVKVGDYEKAIRAYKDAIKLKPDFTDARYNLAHVYNLKEMYDEAIEQYKEIIKLKPSYFAAYGNMGYAYWYKGDLDKAIEQYNKALSINKNYIEGLYNLGLIYKQKGDYKKAITYFNDVLYIAKPDSREAEKSREQIKQLR